MWSVNIINSFLTTEKHERPWIIEYIICKEKTSFYHDDVIKWKHFSALLAICVGNSSASDDFSAQRPVTRSFDLFFDLCLNKWLRNNREAGDLRRYRAHYDVIVMLLETLNQQYIYNWLTRHTISWQKETNLFWP